MTVSFVPRERRFYQLFKLQGGLVNRTLDELSLALGEGATRHTVLRGLEHECDDITHEIYRLANVTFTTPMDRADILALAHALDEIVDLAEEVADRVDLYQVAVSEHAKKLGACLADAGAQIGRAVERLEDFKDLDPVLQEIHRLENEGDGITRRALHELFDADHPSAADLIKWKDVYALLESTLDECETAAEIIERISIKSA